MDPSQQFEIVCRAMSDPGFYPHPVSNIERRDTHISAVFLTGKWAYKLKKPLNLEFLDFRDLADRRKFCERELRLNRRLSRDVYHKVIKIYQRKDATFSLEKKGRVMEYAVKMKQLPDAASFRERLKKNKIRPMHVRKLGHALADFYQQSERSSGIDHYGQRDVIAFNMEENFRQLEPFVDNILESEKWEFIRQVNRSFFNDHLDLFNRRVQAGRIRDGHGDLRTDHVYFYQGIQIIDCIEFNDRFRYGDAAVDLAFLHMDMEHLGFPELSRNFLNAYVDKAGDPEIYTLIDFYAAYRAIVRLKIKCLRLKEIENSEQRFLMDEIRRYTDQAYQYAIRFGRPTLWILCGLPATGKSSLSRKAADALSADLFQSDCLRKEIGLFSQPGVAPFGKGRYRAELRHLVYAHLLAKAQKKLKKGHSVILDATFAHRKWRADACQLAADLDTNIIFAECVSNLKILRTRLKRRETETGISDARLQHLPQLLEDFEPINELNAETHFTVNTEQNVDSTLIKLLAEGYACKCAQVGKIL
jgi:aminoglycoside phosphotransferase family enzyme/predicted kinase